MGLIKKHTTLRMPFFLPLRDELHLKAILGGSKVESIFTSVKVFALKRKVFEMGCFSTLSGTVPYKSRRRLEKPKR